MDNDVKSYFSKKTGLKPSRAWEVFARFGPYNLLGNRRFFSGIHGADHTCVWQSESHYLITTEPYKSAHHNVDALLNFCERYGWDIVKSDFPGWWNPPSTELWMLAPPQIGIDPRTVEVILIGGHLA